MRTLFILGAGASFGSGECWPYASPLGKNLYDELCKYSGDFARETSKFASTCRVNFEKGMIDLASEGSYFIPYITTTMAHYFYNFNPLPNNLYASLITKALSLKHEYAFSTLNYDLLLERSAGHVGVGVTYGNSMIRNKTIRVIKPHCSCNTVPQATGMQFIGNVFQGFEIPFNVPMRYSFDNNQVEAFLYSHDQQSPAMCFYAPKKPVMFGRNLIEEHHEVFARCVIDAEQIVIIGVAVDEDDEHIWGLLSKCESSIIYFGR